MEEMKICPKEGLQLRKVGKQYMIVEACEGNVNMSHVYSLNQTAAQMWERISQGNCTPDDLAECLCEQYETDKDTATLDVKRQLAKWKAYGLIL